MEKEKVKAAIYCRLSDEDRDKESEGDDSNSIINQKSMLIEYAGEQDWEIYDIYSDDDYSGIKANRPEYQRLLQDAKDGRFQIVLCKTQARFTRDAEAVEKYLHRLFPLWGIRFIGVTDSADTSNRGNKKSRQINALVNEWYIEDLSDNVRAGLTRMRKDGKHIGGRALYGYKIDPKDRHHLVVDPEAADVVRRIFQMYISGIGKQEICTTLNKEGILSPSAYKRANGVKANGRSGSHSELWKCPTINYILDNENYIGNLVQGKHTIMSYKVQKTVPVPEEEWIIVRQTHEAVIDQDTWMMARKLRKERSKQGKTGTLSLFAGFVRCRSCGYKAATNKNHDKRYLMCPTRRQHKNACIGFCISEDDLRAAVLKELKGIIAELYDEEAAGRGLIEEKPQRSFDKLKEQYRELQEEGKIIVKAKTDIYLDKARGNISDEECTAVLDELKRQEELLKEKLEQLEQKLEAAETLEKNKETKGEILKKYSSIDSLNRGIITMLIDHIEIGKRTKGGEPPIYIYWNF